MALEIDWFFQHVDTWWHLLSIPIFTGVVGWLINWTGLIMLFSPVRFHGVKVPGMRQLSRLLPRRLQEVPGILQGGLGWQGIVPARAAKMGSIAVDKAIAKLGTPKEFYQELEPDQIAEHIVKVFQPEMPAMIEEIMRRQPLDFVQVSYSAVERDVEARILPLARDRGIAVVINRPFREGTLIRSVKRQPLPPWASEADCANWAEFLLKFIVSHPAILCAIPATTSVAHVRENMGACLGRLPDEAMRRRMSAHIDQL